MRISKIWAIFLLIVLASGMSCAITYQDSHNYAKQVLVGLTIKSPACMHVDPEINYATVGQTFSVNVSIANVTDLMAFEYKLRWNSTVIDCTSYTRLDPDHISWGSPPALGPPFIYDSLTAGQHWLGIVAVANATPFTGNITLATYTFKILNPCNCTLDILDEKLGNSQALPMPHIVEDGYFEFRQLEHDITVFLDSPEHLIPGDSVLLNATVFNSGLNNETDVELQLLINGDMKNSKVISFLQVGSSHTLDYLWTTSTVEATFNVTAYALPVPDEDFTLNNRESARVVVSYIIRVPFHYQTIQEAIDAANPRDTILVSEGTYYEHVNIYKSLTLMGEENSTPVIDGSGSMRACIHVTADNVEISKFTIQNACMHLGIDLSPKSSNNTISGNMVLGNGYGIRLDRSSNNIFKNNMITNNTEAGIYLYGYSEKDDIVLPPQCCNNFIIGNIVSDNGIGIYAHYTENNIIYHNSFINNTNQVFLSNSFDIWDNGCEGNYWSDYNGTDLDGDGIGDTLLPHRGVDNYPLMSPYMEGDANHDAIVDVLDGVTIGLAFSTKPGDPRWNPHADLNEDEIIDVMDILIFGIHFGEKW